MRPVKEALLAALLSLTTAASALCMLPLLGPLFADADWWTRPASAAVTVAAAGAVTQWIRVPAVVTPLVQLVALAITVTAHVLRDTAPLGILPTPGVVDQIIALAFSGVADIQTHVIPVPATDGIVLLVTLLLGVLTISAHWIAVTLRVPGVAAAALLSLIAVPLTVHHEGVDGAAFTWAAVGFLLLFAGDSLVRTVSWEAGAWTAAAAGLWGLGVTGTAAVCIVLALLVPALLPGVSNGSVFSLINQLRSGGRTVSTVDPLTSLRGTLTSTGNRRVLEYRTSDPAPEYLRTHVLDSFNGETWTMSPVEASTKDLLNGTIPHPPGFSTGSDAESVVTDITISTEARGMDFLPLPYPSRDVQVNGEWYVDPETLMVFSPNDDAAGLTYRVTSISSVPDEDALRAAPAATAFRVDQRYVDLPPLSQEVTQLIEEITSGADSPFDQALALQAWFTSGEFTYDLDPPRVPDNADPLAYFLLDSKTGYCQHFASAMAVMARYVGIPARVAVGYTSGERIGSGHWMVRESDAHAWPELYFANYGWLRFEPTPGEGQPNAAVPEYAATVPERAPVHEPSPHDSEPASPSAPAPQDTPAQPSAPEETREPAEPSAAESAPAPGTGAPRTDAVLTNAGIVAAAAALMLVLPALLRRLVRLLRWRRAADVPAHVRAAWSELRDDLIDLGWEWNPAHSPRTVERLLVSQGRVTPQARDALHRIVTAEEAARYAPRPPAASHLADDCRTVRRALAASFPRTSRIRALFLPRSLWQAPHLRSPEVSGTAGRVGRAPRRDPHA